MNSFLHIHQRALEVSKRFKQAEADLILILQEVDYSKTFLKIGHTSLFSYTVQALGLSEHIASNFVTVARKAVEIPVLQAAIQNGLLTVSKARKITPVLNIENQEEWIQKARELSTRKLEQEVARVAPKEATPERLRYVSEERLELRMGISKEIEEKLRRVQDLESQRTSRAVTLEETLEAALNVYLNLRDPLMRTQRVQKKQPEPIIFSKINPSIEKSKQASAAVIHKIRLRDGGQCAHRNLDGTRCTNRRWIDIHHIQPRSEGGDNSPENLISLCKAHHKMQHSA